MKDSDQPNDFREQRALIPALGARNGAEDSGFPPYEEGAEGDESSPSALSLPDLVRALRRRKWLLLLGAICGGLVGATVNVVRPVAYGSYITLEIQGMNENFMNFSQVDVEAGSGTYSATNTNIHTQIKILESVQLQSRVLERLRLESMPPPPSVTGFFQRIRLKLGTVSSNPMENLRHGLGMAIETTKATAVRDTRIIEVRCRSTSPQLAATYLNTLANEYIEQTLEQRSLTSRRTSEWVLNQLSETRTRLDQAEVKLREFERSTGYTSPTQQDTLAGTKLRQLKTELSGIQADRITKESRYALAKSSPPESLPEVLDDASLQSKQTQILDLRRQIADLQTTLTPAHYKVKRLVAQLAELEAEAEKDRKKAVDRIRLDFVAAQEKEKLLAAAFQKQSGAYTAESERAAQRHLLQRELDITQQIYNGLLQQANQATMAAAIPTHRVRTIDKALPELRPVSFPPPLPIVIGLFCGALILAGTVILREVTNGTVRTPRASSGLLNVPELGVIPSWDVARNLDAQAVGNGKGAATRPSLLGRLTSAGPAVALDNELWNGRSSLFADSFRVALASLIISNDRHGGCQVLAITSPGPSEGKTSVTVNLGIAMAEAGRKTLLVDLDLRRPELHDRLRLPNDRGVCDLIAGEAAISSYSLEDLAVPTGYPGLLLLPAGPAKPGTLAGILYHPRMKELLVRLRTEFDFILIDTTPMLGFSDARAAGRLSDGVVMVLRSDITSRESALDARRHLNDDGTLLIGTILNDLKTPPSHREAYYSYLRADGTKS